MSTKEFQVNEFLTVKLVYKQTRLYIKGKLFRLCKFLFLNHPSIQHGEQVIDEHTFQSEQELRVDTIAGEYNWTEEGQKVEGAIIDITKELTPEEIFWAHCSNLQVWAESDYDGNLLHSHLAFPLLVKLQKYDPIAKEKYTEEIKKRILHGDVNTVQYLVDGGYLGGFSDNEIMKLVLKVQHTTLISSEATKERMIIILKTTPQWYNVHYSTTSYDTGLIICSTCEKFYDRKEIAYFRGSYYMCKNCHNTLLKVKPSETSLTLNKFYKLLNKQKLVEAVSCINSLLAFNYFSVVQKEPKWKDQNEFIQSKDKIINIIPGTYLWDKFFIFYSYYKRPNHAKTYILTPSDNINHTVIPIKNNEVYIIQALRDEVLSLSKVETLTNKYNEFKKVTRWENYYPYLPYLFLLNIIENPVIELILQEKSPLVIRNNKIRANILPIREIDLPKHKF